MQKWNLLDSEFVINHRWCRVRRDRVKLPSGEVVDDFFVNVRPDIALVLPITPEGNVVFVRQYRHGVGEVLLELPAGAFDPEEEEAETAAKREFEEETGYRLDRLNKIATLYDNPVKDTNRIHLFLAEDVELSGTQRLDRTEEIEVVLVPISEISDKIRSGELCVAGTLAALFLVLSSRFSHPFVNRGVEEIIFPDE
ncbi:NUDIX hydrolase [Baaleninema sp.]|uniref:NUDIX hydrolase n=1 Tax=Baaleninema sp. TaxID=3101197 RepID=UPI003D06FD8B